MNVLEHFGVDLQLQKKIRLKKELIDWTLLLQQPSCEDFETYVHEEISGYKGNRHITKLGNKF